MEINIKFNLSRTAKRKVIFALILLALGLAGWWLIQNRGGSTIPGEIKSQLSFRSVYAPADWQPQTFNYVDQQKTLSFKFKFEGSDMVATEQPAPDSLVSGSQVYFQGLGIRPTAQFATRAGQVAIANFYQTGTLEASGQAGILLADKTMVIIQPTDPQKKMTNDQWKRLFDGLKLSR